jgi:glutathione reductase (NADPH)
VPKKLLVYAAQFSDDLAHAGDYGWTIDRATFDWPTLRDAVARDVDRINLAYTSTLNNNHVAQYLDRAEVTGPNSVRMKSTGQTVTAKTILVATGAWPIVPEFDGTEHCITSNEVFSLPTLPRRVVVAGAGYIALEFAGIFNALGSTVTVVNRSDAILRSYDIDLRTRLLALTRARGIAYRFHATLDRVEKCADGSLLVHLGDGGAPVPADVVLVAAGRRANTAGLGLEHAGIALGHRGEVPVDGDGRTTCPSIYAVGDVTDRVQLTPVAIREGHAFADAQYAGKKTAVSYDAIPSAVFSQPPLAAVGLTEAEARLRHAVVKVFTSDFRPMKNIFSQRVERGFYKLVVDGETDRVLGIHMIGPDAPEILQAAAIAVKAGLTKADFDATVALHPSMAEELVLMR